MRSLKRLLLVTAVLCVAFPWISFPDENGENTPLSLGAFIERVRTHGSFESILIRELSLAYDNTLNSDDIELLLQAGASYSIDLGNAGNRTVGGSLAVSGNFPETGTTISAGYDTGRASAFSGGGQTSGILFKIEQSVLQNAFGRSSRLKNLIAGNEMTVARYQILEAYEDYLAQIINLYLQWYAAFRALDDASQAYKDAETLLALTRQKQRYGVAAEIDVNKSNLQLLSKEDQLLSARAAYETLRMKISRLLGVPAERFRFIPAPLSIPANPEVDTAKEKERFLTESRTAKILTLLSEINQQELDVSLDELLPTAKVYAAYSLDGENFFPSGSVSNGLELGFSLSVPLYSPEAEAKAGKNRVELEKTTLSEKNQREELGGELTDLLSRMETGKKQLALSGRKRATARLILQEERTRYAQGRVGLDNVISAQDSLDAVGRSELAVIVELTSNYIEWLRFTDRLVDDRHQVTDASLKENP